MVPLITNILNIFFSPNERRGLYFPILNDDGRGILQMIKIMDLDLNVLISDEIVLNNQTYRLKQYEGNFYLPQDDDERKHVVNCEKACPAGPPGPPGSPGKDGKEGPKGASGSPGSPGQKGETGLQGQEGMSGSPGSPGEQGPEGHYGRPGQPGSKGAKGSTGPRGSKGQQGSKGEDRLFYFKKKMFFSIFVMVIVGCL